MITRYARTFVKRWYLYIVPIIVLPVLATIYGHGQLMLYNSTALVYVEKPAFLSAEDFGWNPYLSPASNEASAMQELLQSESFVATVAQNTDLANMYDLNTRAGKDAAFYRITPEVSIYASDIGPHNLFVSVTDRSPHMALQIVQALLAQYSAYYQNHRIEVDKQAISFYGQQLAAAQSQLAQDAAQLQEYLGQHLGANGSTDPTLANLEQQVQQDQSKVSNLQTQLANLRQDMQAINTGGSQLFTVLDPPQLPLAPTIQRKKLLMYTGYGLGAALGVVGLCVVLLTLLDRKVYTRYDLQVIGDSLDLDLPAIETLPVIKGIGERAGSELEDDAYDGILMPILTALPRLGDGQMRQEIRRMAGARGTMTSEGSNVEVQA
jgi:uncharacterized protein involved in exopolysaccharide biosynthesis